MHVSSIFGDVDLDDIYTLVVNLPNDGIDDVALDPGKVETASDLQGGSVGGFDALYRALCSPGTLRVETRWMKASFSVLSDDQAFEQTMDSAKSDATKLDEWITANYSLVTPKDAAGDQDASARAPSGYCDDDPKPE